MKTLFEEAGCGGHIEEQPGWSARAGRLRPQLAKLAGQASAASKLPIHRINVDKVGEGDAMSFAARQPVRV